ncbi:MAG: hypothetical protein E7278_09760 [Lachnospiraceae bacterium]|nr:hypothetical protein [Lachnospiraceae bacterium]
MNKNRKRVTGRVIATACTGLMLMQGVVTPTVLAAELPGSAIEANAYGESSTFTLDSTVKKIKLYETVHLQATLNSKNVEDRYLKWECDNANVANVSNGYITGMNTGRTNITVTYLPTGETAHCQLTVGTIPGEDGNEFKLDSSEKKIKLYETIQLKALAGDDVVQDRDLKWESSNKDVANVNNGYVTGMNNGKTTITVTYVPTGLTATCELTVGTIPGENGAEFKIDSSTKAIRLWETVQLKAMAGDDVMADKDIKWESSNPSVATVNNGYVSGISVGTTTIKATYLPSGLVATCEVSVSKDGSVTPEPTPGPGPEDPDPIVNPEVNFTLDANVKTVKVGKTNRILAKVDGKNAATKDLEFSVDKPEIATVNSLGVITGVAAGKATVTVTYKPTGQTAVCQVAVEKDQDEQVEFTLDANVKTVKVGKTNRILAKVDGKNAATKDLEFSVDKPEIATVNSLGVITGVAAGKAKVTVTYKPTGQTAVCQVAVEKDQEAPVVLEGELVLDQKVVAVEAGKTAKVTATINGKEVPRTDLKWTADKSDIAVVRNDGTILGLKAGKAKVTVTYVPTGKTAEVMVAVTAQKEVLEGEISLDKSYIELQPKDVTKVTATINGKEIPSADYKWTTSDPNVATVKGGGILAVAPGKATITVTYKPTGKTASVAVVVKDAQAQQVDFALDANVKTVKVGKTNRILAKVDGKNAAIKDLEFSVDKPEVATVNNMGVITGVAAGKAKVTVTYKPTGQTAECQIAVEKDQEAVVTGITFDSKIKSVDVGKTTRVLVKVNGQNAKLDDLAFSVDYEQYATVNKMGVITGVKRGRCVVTVTYLPTGETAKLPVSVH